jgi:hypothetical protein
MSYTATISRQYRDVKTGSPKVLLTNIVCNDTEGFRDHCWVTLTKELAKTVPSRCGIKALIEFEAEPKEYYTGKLTLNNIKDIQLLR